VGFSGLRGRTLNIVGGGFWVVADLFTGRFPKEGAHGIYVAIKGGEGNAKPRHALACCH